MDAWRHARLKEEARLHRSLRSRPVRGALLGLIVAFSIAAASVAPVQAQRSEGERSRASSELRPNVERPLSFEEFLWLRGAHPRSRDKLTVIADARIGRPARMRTFACPGTALICPFGVLSREAPGLDDPVVLASKITAASFRDGRSGITGTLAFALGERLVLLGQLWAPGDAHALSFDDDLAVVAESVSVGSLVLLEGWLNAVPGRDCALFDPDHAAVSPAGCPVGWLAPEPLDPTVPLEPTLPTTSGLAVRMSQFRSQAPEPNQPAAYLIRRVEDSSPATGAMVRWEVAGRVDVIGVRGAHDPPVVPPPSGLDWQAVADPQPPADTRAMRLTAWAGGFLSVQEGLDRIFTAWASPDGVTWAHAPLPTGIRSVGAVVPLSDKVVLTANHRTRPEPGFDVWMSTDGLRWRRTARPRFPASDRFPGYRHFVDDIGVAHGTLVVRESYDSSPCCGRAGWTLLAASRQNGERPDRVEYVHTSADGKRFERTRLRRIVPAQPNPGRSLRSGAMLETWYDGGRAYTLGASNDGITWHAIGSLPDELDPTSSMRITATADGFVLAGEAFEAGNGPGNHLTIWHGSPELQWTRVFDIDHRVPDDVVVAGSTVIVVGTRLQPGDEDLDEVPRRPWILVSTDGGATWDPSLAWDGNSHGCELSLAAHDDTIVLGDHCPAEGASALFMVDVLTPAAEPPSDATATPDRGSNAPGSAGPEAVPLS